MDLGLAVCRFSKAEVGRHARGGPQGNQPPSSHQGPDAESSGSSTAHSSVQLQGGPDLSGGDAADSPHPRVAGSSGSAVEIHLDHVPEAQDSQEANLGQPTCASSPIGSTIPSASGGTSSSSSIQARATRTSQKHHESRPRHKRHMGDRCFVRVTLAEDSGHKVQSILVTDQDRAPAVIHKVLEEHELAREQPKDYQLVQIISGDGTLQIIDGANVYYAMAPSPDYGFLLLRKTTPWMPSFSRLSKPTKPISSMAPPPGSVPGTPKVHGTREAQGGLVAHGVGRRL
nr:ral guanine nucleotide dissociation stimulator-like [Dasypus novemcinctus]